uniref:Dipeptidase n=1 Tax=Cacopsylla melanoneura TaxID=428564 RepID=A0A8D8VKL6_9HEMI
MSSAVHSHTLPHPQDYVIEYKTHKPSSLRGTRRSLSVSEHYRGNGPMYRTFSDDHKAFDTVAFPTGHITNHFHESLPQMTCSLHHYPSLYCEARWCHDHDKMGGAVYPRVCPRAMFEYRQYHSSYLDDSCSEEDNVPPPPCLCDRGYPSYKQMKQEEGILCPPDVTQRDITRQEVTFYPTSTPTNSTSTTAGIGWMGGCINSQTKRWWIMLLVIGLAGAAGLGVPIALKIHSGASYEERLEFASRLLQEVPLIDGHNDLPWNIRKFVHNKLSTFKFAEDLRKVPPWSESAWSHTDLPRLRAGHISAQFWAAYVPCESAYKDAIQLTLEQIDVIKRLTDKYSPPLTFCTSAQDIVNAHSKGQLCSLIGVEGGHSIANSLPVLRILYSLGVRYMTLTSTCNTQWADSSLADDPGKKPEHSGLTNFGKIIVKEMNRLGMLVDLSHVSVQTMQAALDTSKAPVVFSHSSARALCNSSRNVPDHILAKLALNRGLVMVNFYSQFLTCTNASSIQDAAGRYYILYF